MEKNKGIDYSLGQSNINLETGIRFGVISSHSLMPEASNEIWSEGSVYVAFCPHCYEEIKTDVEEGMDCPSCGETIENEEDCYGEEPSYIEYHEQTPDGEIVIVDCLDTDYMVLRSPYVTRGAFCSPCVPGAIDLDAPMEEGELAYCLPKDFFEEGEIPYKYSLRTILNKKTCKKHNREYVGYCYECSGIVPPKKEKE